MKTSTFVLVVGYLCICSMMVLRCVCSTKFICPINDIIRVRRSVLSFDDHHTLAKHIASCFSVMTIPISLFQLYEHLSGFCKPRLQVQIVRILCMVEHCYLLHVNLFAVCRFLCILLRVSCQFTLRSMLSFFKWHEKHTSPT